MKTVTRFCLVFLTGFLLWAGWNGVVPTEKVSAFTAKRYQVYLPLSLNTTAPSSSTCLKIPAQATSDLTYEAQTLELINQERAKVGAPPLESNTSLQQIARYHSNDMATTGQLDHTGSEGETFGDRMQWGCDSYSWAGEIIANGYADPASVVNGWLNSPTHHDIMLDPTYTHAGVGYASSTATGSYWTADFITVRQ